MSIEPATEPATVAPTRKPRVKRAAAKKARKHDVVAARKPSAPDPVQEVYDYAKALVESLRPLVKRP